MRSRVVGEARARLVARLEEVQTCGSNAGPVWFSVAGVKDFARLCLKTGHGGTVE